MRRGQSFSDERVRHLKRLMLQGADIVALAIQEGVSANTLRRMKAGETYNGVVVEGEERLRPLVVYPDYVPPAGEGQVKAAPRVIPITMPTQESVDEMIASIMAEGPKDAFAGYTEEEIAQARIFGAKG